MLTIHNRIAACDDGNYRQRLSDPIGITVHMFGVDGINDAAGIANWMRLNPQWTGGQMCYTFVVHPAGMIEQALPMQEVGPHALRWSSLTIGVVALGDFNNQSPPSAQWYAMADLCVELCFAIGKGPCEKIEDNEWCLAGHTERKGGTKHSDKVCPGYYWEMHKFRTQVADLIKESAMQRLITAGAV